MNKWTKLTMEDLKRTIPTECRHCGVMIQWKPDRRKDLWNPYNVSDGKLHFNTCPNAKRKRR